MNKVFCSDCGHKNIYEVTQPKFCAGCGAEMGVKASISAVEKVLSKSGDVFVESGRDVVGSFDLAKMRNEIAAENTGRPLKLNEIMGSSSSSSDYTREAANLPDGEELLNKNKQDCGSSKTQDIDA